MSETEYKDLYFDPNYAKLYEKIEHGKAVFWEYNGKEGKITNSFLLRKIECDGIEGEYYDIVSPYGYGGPVIIEINDGYTKEDLVDAFEREFSKYCIDHNMVSEFIRFHPIENNGVDFQRIYNSECIRHTVGTNLKDFDDPVASEFGKHCRKKIKRVLREGIEWRITEHPDDVSGFTKIYYSTMDRNEATDYYYFGDEYFEDCVKYFKDHLLFVEALYNGQTIAAGFYFIYNKTIHIHLSGTLTEYLHLSPAYILRYATTLWGKEHGYELIHHGGGRSNAPDDELYTFKQQFGKNTEFGFYVGRKIWNQEIYNKLCEVMNKPVDTAFFPAYRA